VFLFQVSKRFLRTLTNRLASWSGTSGANRSIPNEPQVEMHENAVKSLTFTREECVEPYRPPQPPLYMGADGSIGIQIIRDALGDKLEEGITQGWTKDPLDQNGSLDQNGNLDLRLERLDQDGHHEGTLDHLEGGAHWDDHHGEAGADDGLFEMEVLEVALLDAITELEVRMYVLHNL
jgi:hypothetical protein